jgi:hypothetical protein
MPFFTRRQHYNMKVQTRKTTNNMKRKKDKHMKLTKTQKNEINNSVKRIYGKNYGEDYVFRNKYNRKAQSFSQQTFSKKNFGQHPTFKPLQRETYEYIKQIQERIGSNLSNYDIFKAIQKATRYHLDHAQSSSKMNSKSLEAKLNYFFQETPEFKNKIKENIVSIPKNPENVKLNTLPLPTTQKLRVVEDQPSNIDILSKEKVANAINLQIGKNKKVHPLNVNPYMNFYINKLKNIPNEKEERKKIITEAINLLKKQKTPDSTTSLLIENMSKVNILLKPENFKEQIRKILQEASKTNYIH